MRRIDNQIDVMSKAFLGLTVACARCHDHKFDPIASRDYYALAGYLRSSRIPAGLHRPPRPDRRAGPPPGGGPRRDPWILLRAGSGDPSDGRVRRSTIRPAGRAARKRRSSSRTSTAIDYGDWQVTGDAFGERPSRAGDVRIDLLRALAEAASGYRRGLAHSGLVSDRLQGVLRSRTFTIESRYIHYLAAGPRREAQRRRGRLREDPRPDLRRPDDGRGRGRPLLDGSPRTSGCGSATRPISRSPTAPCPIIDGAATAHERRPGLHRRRRDPDVRPPGSARRVARARIGPASQDLDSARRRDLRPGQPQLAARLREAIDRYRAIEAAIPEPTLALAVADGTGMDEQRPHPGQSQDPRRAGPAAVPGGPGRDVDGHARRRQRPAGAGPSAGRSRRQSPDASRAGQPALEAPFRRGDRQVHRRLRRDGPRADPSRAARLARRRGSSRAAGRSRPCTG